MTEGIALLTKVVTEMENGMSAQEAESKYGARIKDYNARCQSISPPEEVQKKLFKENFQTMMELDKRFIAAGIKAKGLPPKVLLFSWKKTE